MTDQQLCCLSYRS